MDNNSLYLDEYFGSLHLEKLPGHTRSTNYFDKDKDYSYIV
jgi:hypothetical protein